VKNLPFPTGEKAAGFGLKIVPRFTRGIGGVEDTPPILIMI